MCQRFAPKPLAASARRGWRELVCLDPKRQRLCSPKRFDSFESPSPTAMWCAATCPCPASGARHSKPQLADVGITVTINVMEVRRFLGVCGTPLNGHVHHRLGADYPDTTNYRLSLHGASGNRRAVC